MCEDLRASYAQYGSRQGGPVSNDHVDREPQVCRQCSLAQIGEVKDRARDW